MRNKALHRIAKNPAPGKLSVTPMNDYRSDTMKSRPRLLIASSAGAIVTMAPPMALVLLGFLGGSSIRADGTPDNAPYRATLVLLFLSPLIFGLLLVLWYLMGRVLHSLGSLSKTSIIACCIAISLVIGIIFGVESFKQFGTKEAAISFSIFTGSSFVCLMLGFATWWAIAFSRRNKRLQRIADKSGSR